MKITKQPLSHKPMKFVNDGNIYDYYIAIDWSSTVMSIAWLRNNSLDPVVKKDLSSKLKVITDFIQELKGKKILTIEETTGAQWLYVELKDYVEKIIICNPHRNALLKDGPRMIQKMQQIYAGY